MKSRIIKGTYGSSFYTNKEANETEMVCANKMNDLFGRVPQTVNSTVAGRIVVGKASQENPENRVRGD